MPVIKWNVITDEGELCETGELWVSGFALSSTSPSLRGFGPCWHWWLCILTLLLPPCQVSMIFIVFTDTVSNLQVPWIRCVRLWVHRICKVCYTGMLWPIKDPHIMRSLSSPDFCYTFPGLHNEETGRAKNLPTLGCSHLNIQHSLLFRRPRLKWEALSGTLSHPHLSHLLSV